jgi:hypothetical protein
LLDLVCDLFRVYRLEDVGCDGWEEGEDGVGAVLLVLLEAATQAGGAGLARAASMGGEAVKTHFSLAIRSLLMRSRASRSLPST